MEWYLTRAGAKRLQLEAEQMQSDEGSRRFSLYHDTETGDLMWRGPVSVHGHLHQDVRLIYDENHPYEKMTIYVRKPELMKHTIHIHPDGSCCVMRDEEWSPQWTPYTVYLTVLRFLTDYYEGRLE